jgi:hypothetical protein
MEPAGLSQNALARAPRAAAADQRAGPRQARRERRQRSAPRPLFRLSEGFFLGLQADYDLMQRKREIAAELLTIQPRAA